MPWFDALPVEVRTAFWVLIAGVIYGAARWIKNRGDRQAVDIQELKDDAQADKDARAFLHKTALEAQARLDKLEQENQRLRDQVGELTKTKAANDRELEIRNKDLQAANVLLREMAETLGSLNAKYDRAILDNMKLTERVDGLETRQKDNHALVNQAHESVQQAGVNLLAAEKERDAAQAALKKANELNADLAARLETAEGRIVFMQTEIDDLKKQIETDKSPAPVAELAVAPLPDSV